MKLKIKLPKLKVPKGLTRAIGKTVMTMKRHEPEILALGGVITGGFALITTGKGTIKALDAHKEYVDNKNAIESMHSSIIDGTVVADYSEEDYIDDISTNRRNQVIDIVRAYAPAAIFYVTSMTMFMVSIGVLKKRNTALAAGYITLQTAFKQYRERVAAHVGSDVENDIYHGRGASTETVTVDPDTGEVTAEVTSQGALSPYSRLFKKGNVYYEDDCQYNLMILNRCETELNELLSSRGYLFLNEALAHLGFEPTLAGQEVGWLHDGNGDGYVSLGLTKEKIREFIDNDVHEIWLDFNVDGPILSNFPAGIIDTI